MSDIEQRTPHTGGVETWSVGVGDGPIEVNFRRGTGRSIFIIYFNDDDGDDQWLAVLCCYEMNLSANQEDLLDDDLATTGSPDLDFSHSVLGLKV